MPFYDAMANPWSSRVHAVRNRERKSWTPHGNFHLVAASISCARDFEARTRPNSFEGRANKVCLG